MLLNEGELSPTEKALKDFWRKNPEHYLGNPYNVDEINGILNTAYAKMGPLSVETFHALINEHIFISDELDTAFVRHMRYNPPFWHNHEFFELLYVLNGSCINTVYDQKITMKTGDICMIAPKVLHAVSAFSDDDILLNILIRKSTFENSFMGLLEGDDILSDFFKRTFYQTTEIPYLVFHTNNDARLHQYVEEAYQEYNGKHRYKKQMLNAIFSEFFIVLFRNHEHNIEVPNLRLNTSEDVLIYILRYMQAHYTTVTLKELSAFFNYSERQLQRIILKATGMTFKENIQKQKIAKAADLLLHSELTISSISEQLGFHSFNNFRKIFYKYYQSTPSEFRKKNHGA